MRTLLIHTNDETDFRHFKIDTALLTSSIDTLLPNSFEPYTIILVSTQAYLIHHRSLPALGKQQALFLYGTCDQTVLNHAKQYASYVDFISVPFSLQQWQWQVQKWQDYQVLKDSESRERIRLETLMNNVPYMTWFKDTDSNYQQANQEFQTHSGKTASQIAGRNDHFVWNGHIGERCREYDLQVMNERTQVVFDEIIPGTRGYRQFNVYKAPIIDDTDNVVGVIGIAKDMTDILNDQAKHAMIIDNLPFAVSVRNLDGEIMNMNSKYQAYVDQPVKVGDSVYDPRFMPNELDRQTIIEQDADVLRKGVLSIYRTSVKRRGKVQHLEFHKAPIFDIEQKVQGIIVILRDITQSVQQEQKIAKLAYEDSLTGLANRSGLYKYIEKYEQGTQASVVMFIDLDGFKQVNDTYGHEIGDVMIQATARRIQQFLPKACIARDGGDKFTVILSHAESLNQSLTNIQARILLDELRKPVLHNMKTYHVCASIGLVNAVVSLERIDEIIAQGELALQVAKQRGNNEIVMYTPKLDAKRRRNAQFIADIKIALEREEVELFYQPQYTCDGDLVGFEALFRWQSATYADLNVLAMIELIEASPLINQFGVYVMRKAMAFAKRINDGLLTPLTVAINVSAKQIMADNFYQTVQRLLAETGVHPEWVELEITETVLMDNIDANITKLEKIRKLGIAIALDDFGTGYSSLNYLVKLPLSQVKIDRSFIRELTTSPQYQTLVQLIIEAAHALNLPVVAEGVETREERELLASWNADYIQGYYFSKPLPHDQAIMKITRK